MSLVRVRRPLNRPEHPARPRRNEIPLAALRNRKLELEDGRSACLGNAGVAGASHQVE